MKRLIASVVLLGACSLLNRDGPSVTCASLANGASNACKSGIIATCVGDGVIYEVCDLDTACEQGWQTKGAYRCSESDPLPDLRQDGTPRESTQTAVAPRPACDPGSACVLASVQAANLVVDDSNLYFDDCSNVKRLPKTGGEVTVLATGLTGCGGKGLYVDDTSVYVQDGSTGIVRVPKEGGTLTKVLSSSNVLLFAMDTANVYWAGGAVDVLKAIPKVGGNPTTLTTNTDFQATRMSVVGGFVYWLGSGTRFNRVSTSVTAPTDPSSMNLNQTAADFAVDDTSVYVLTQGAPGGGSSGALWSESLASGTTQQLAAEGGTSLVVDSSTVYIRGDRSIKKVPKSGGNLTTVVTADAPIETRIVVDDTSVYWAGSGKIMKAEK